ncbi:peptidyl-prolyl cis-trans isomerase [Marinobacterium sp. AK62]|uniref:Peptidyl-prolyl cis-trans isomerase n=1 Tax=Marinobacterium alkalitolerans TaxID=1542925 RepID=A0ABS3ZEG0_9GAMM|nr:peptidylprolyl isomerase [Marinobacterium alkalitolerans]MBP0049409.1 peptidyl-prolyl cis-trans isomerase [Marinobacterium alkalitolerans]
MLKQIVTPLLFASSLVMADTAPPVQVEMTTSAGTIRLELNADKAPITVRNFLNYAEQGHFNGLTFHRVIPGFMIQGGGFTPDMQPRQTGAPIQHESNNGLSNRRGSIAMARTRDPDSATSQFFINLVDNRRLDGMPGRPGYTVFGRVTEGMETVERIGQVKTETRGYHRNVPVEAVVIESVKKVEPAQENPGQ